MGYSVVCSTLRKQIGPCYADDSLIARSFYQDLLVKVAVSDSQAIIDVSIPSGQQFIKDTEGIMKELQGELVYQTVRIYFGGVPDISFKNMFAIPVHNWVE